MASLRAETVKIKDSTPTHKFIRTLADSGKLLRCYTQNIDGLETRDGLVTDLACGKGKRKRPAPVMLEDTRTSEEKGCQVVQLHGELQHLRCTQCQQLTTYSTAYVKSLMSGTPPACPACEQSCNERVEAGKRATGVGMLRPNVVLYGEEHPQAEEVGKLSEADIRAAPDLMIIMGTSLKVHGLKRIVREFAKAVHAKQGAVVFVNRDAPAESMWNGIIDFHVEMDCDAWVAEVRKRRPGIFEKQTKLPAMKVVKAIGQVVKKLAGGDKENAAPKAKADTKPAVTKALAPSRKRKSLADIEVTNGAAKMVTKLVKPRPVARSSRLPSPSDSSDAESEVIATPKGRKTRTALGTRVTAGNSIQILVDQQLEVEATPSKRRRRMQDLTPPATPSVKGGRMKIAVVI